MNHKNKGGRPLKYDRAMTEMIAFAITPEQKARLVQFRDVVDPNHSEGLGSFVRELVLGEVVRQTGVML